MLENFNLFYVHIKLFKSTEVEDTVQYSYKIRNKSKDINFYYS
jgi:hypothetical protein